LGGPVQPSDNLIIIPEVPQIPAIYEATHPDRNKKFPVFRRKFLDLSTDSTNLTVRHELDHDTESVFWLLLYWVLGAQPEGKEDEPVDLYIWTGLTGTVK